MALCSCSMLLAPRCEFHHCRERADWSVWMPSWGENPQPRAYLKFMCDGCWGIYKTAMTIPMKGIDRPSDAPDDWQPSLLDHIRFAQIAIGFEERGKKTAAPQYRKPELWEVKMFGWTPSQIEQVVTHRRLMAKHGLFGSALSRPQRS